MAVILVPKRQRVHQEGLIAVMVGNLEHIFVFLLVAIELEPMMDVPVEHPLHIILLCGLQSQ